MIGAMATWEERKAAGIANARDTLSGRSDAVELRDAVAEWLGAIEAQSPNSEVVGLPSTQALVELFEARDLAEVAGALRSLERVS